MRDAVAEAKGGPRAEESARIYLGHSNNLEKEVRVRRLKPEEAARLRHNSALCIARKVFDDVLSYRESRAGLDRVFAQYRQKVGNHEIHDVDNN